MRDPVLEATCAALDRVGAGLYAVACSGGADSLALADATIRLAGAAHVVVIAIDHGLQVEAAAVATGVATWARGQGAAAIVERVAVRPGASLEAAARAARYIALDRLADRLGVAAIFLGHTARDQAETVLLRILRGTGPAGLAAMVAQRERYVRPLLALPREAIDAYAAARALPVWRDPMNADLRFARVRVREQLLPLLRSENPRLDDALLRLAASAGEWLEVIDTLALPFARFPIDAPMLARHPAAVRKRALALALEAVGIGYSATHLAAGDALVVAPSRGERRLELPDATLWRSYATITVRTARDAAKPAPASPALLAPPGHTIRAWQPGDRMRPHRLQGRSRKLSDLLGAAKIPRSERATARVLVRDSDQEIVWAEHVGLAHGAAGSATPRPAERPGPFR